VREAVSPLTGTEREGFEPSIEVSPYAGLANRCLKPLGHHSWAPEIEGAEGLAQAATGFSAAWSMPTGTTARSVP
jgi:hypothetical protein